MTNLPISAPKADATTFCKIDYLFFCVTFSTIVSVIFSSILLLLPGAIDLVIRPFQFGDILVVQRLSRQATKLTTTQALLQPYSAFGAALSALLPWNHAKVTTYILHRRDHELARSGILQVRKRAGRPEADIVLLAPALDTAWGHPAIWQKLLAHYVNEAPLQQISRVYADVPDQPLLINTFSQVGFRVFTRQTIWRLAPYSAETFVATQGYQIRPATAQDDWALKRLYARLTPAVVQQAKALEVDSQLSPPILVWWHSGSWKNYVLESAGEVQACVQLAYGQRGVWLQLWADFEQPDQTYLHELVRFGLIEIHKDAIRLPVYIAVNEYEGGLGSLLASYGFAPFTDRARMVKHLVQWVKAIETLPIPATLEGVQEVAPTSYILSKEASE